ncbi:MAG: ribosome assembly cofactor RimP [Leeuwenhoekiella sp.]
MLKEKVARLIDEALEENESLFLIDWNIDAQNHITVILDGDEGISVTDCMEMSRKIEHNLDRDEEDFSLEVMSAGATAPLINKRQYPKHLGRTLEVKDTSGNTVEGTLEEATGDHIKLVWKAREPKPVGKGKVTVTKEAVVTYEEIDQAKVKIKF